jgi:glycosyltransferase involved in cell wall biosynthesis
VLLSIVICNYNYGRFLDAAIRSALGQSYCNKEVVVVDDGSTDESRAVIARFDGQLKAVLMDRNEGQIEAYNRGFAAATGDIVIFLDSDDLLDLEVGERIVARFQDPDVVKVHYKMRLIGPEGEALGPSIPRRLADGDVSRHLLDRGLLYDSAPGSGNAYRVSALSRLMPLPASAVDRHGADSFALLGISLLGSIRSLGQDSYASYRVHHEHSRHGTHFGNANIEDPSHRHARYLRLRQWVNVRLGPAYQLPPDMVDFSTDKQLFAHIVFGGSYKQGVSLGSKYFVSKLLRSIWRRPAPLPERVGLLGWAVAVLVLPRDLGLPIARLICNPASRT